MVLVKNILFIYKKIFSLIKQLKNYSLIKQKHYDEKRWNKSFVEFV